MQKKKTIQKSHFPKVGNDQSLKSMGVREESLSGGEYRASSKGPSRSCHLPRSQMQFSHSHCFHLSPLGPQPPEPGG